MIGRTKAVFVELELKSAERAESTKANRPAFQQRCTAAGIELNAGVDSAVTIRFLLLTNFFHSLAVPMPPTVSLFSFNLTDHIHIDHGDSLIERENRIVDVIVRTKKPLFLARKAHKDQRAFVVLISRELASEFDDRSRPGCIIIGTVMDLGRVCRKTSLPAMSQMIVVSTDNDRFIFQLRVGPGRMPITLKASAFFLTRLT